MSLYDTDGYKRITALFDDGSFSELDKLVSDEVVTGYGTVNGIPCYAFSQVGGSSIGSAHCAKIKKIYDLASKTGCPVIGIYDSNGVKLDEGFDVLNSYGDILKVSTSVSGVIPQISVIAGASLGVSALIANMADVVIALKDADFYITPPSDITAEENSKKGVVDILADDFESAVNDVQKLVSLLPENNLSPLPVLDFTDPADSTEFADEGSVLELKKDYCDYVKTSLCTVAGRTTGVIDFNGNEVGSDAGYKTEAFIKLCDAFNIPIVTVANAAGFKKNNEAQMLIAATRLASAYASATCPKISLITKQSVGGAYVLLAGKGANADLTLAWENAAASPLDVDAAVAFLYSERLAGGESREALAQEYITTSASAVTASKSGAIDNVFAPSETRARIIEALDILSGKRETTIPRKHSVK